MFNDFQHFVEACGSSRPYYDKERDEIVYFGSLPQDEVAATVRKGVVDLAVHLIVHEIGGSIIGGIFAGVKVFFSHMDLNSPETTETIEQARERYKMEQIKNKK